MGFYLLNELSSRTSTSSATSARAFDTEGSDVVQDGEDAGLASVSESDMFKSARTF